MTKQHHEEEQDDARQRRRSRKLFRRQQTRPAIDAYIPPYLQKFLSPYHGDFCFSRSFHPRLIGQLMSEGFLPIATVGILLPKLHEQRSVIALPNALHISKSIRKKAKHFQFTVNRDFQGVIQGCLTQHGTRCWLYPPLVEAFHALHRSGLAAEVFEQNGKTSTGRTCPVRLYTIEVWNGEALAAGEIGYTVGSIYTSLTGFSAMDSAGSVQLAALGGMLSTLGFSLWDMGMDMEYKKGLGSHLMPRDEFVAHVKAVRETKGHLVLPTTQRFSAKEIVNGTAILFPDSDSSFTKSSDHDPPPPNATETPPMKKKKSDIQG